MQNPIYNREMSWAERKNFSTVPVQSYFEIKTKFITKIC
jgi:hypothetical protein